MTIDTNTAITPTRDTTVVISTADVVLTLNNAAYKGCVVRVICDSSGKVTYTDKSGASVTDTISGNIGTYIFCGTYWYSSTGVIGQYIVTTNRQYTTTNGWVNNKAYNFGLTVPAGKYMMSVQMGTTAGFAGEIFISSVIANRDYHFGISRANSGNIYDTCAGCYPVNFTTAVNTININYYSNAASIVFNLYFFFTRIA